MQEQAEQAEQTSVEASAAGFYGIRRAPPPGGDGGGEGGTGEGERGKREEGSLSASDTMHTNDTIH